MLVFPQLGDGISLGVLQAPEDARLCLLVKVLKIGLEALSIWVKKKP